MSETRLARLEEKIDSLSKSIDQFIESQGDHNDKFYEIRDRVRDMQANAKGAWWTVGLFGTLTVAVSSLVAWLVANIK
jgi:type IV secretory pathway component VirB8